ncbi:MAG TPA: bifunctional methylenetetrahydrofolate dehydrogenase/methenyltetrahydrofolate cyclohydrolase FolD [Myxococcaceae bacterium]|nr:bifunctional methylenetetrahydrofolate dehydrogenase/methenyltetrahydrofolate cyclohydrolase FolD [Myxococcaceae bacterium]
MAQLIDGKAIAAKVRAEVAEGVKRLQESKGIVPGLAVVRVGEDPASKVYVGGKRKAAKEIGFHEEEHHFDEKVSQAEVLDRIAQLNASPKVHGILVQLPVPKHLNGDELISAVMAEKDADGFHPFNAGNLALGRPATRPCTPLGVMRMLQEIGFNPSGKRAVVVGRSNIVGKPMALMLLQADATVTICHRKSDLAREVAEADVLVVAVGVAELIKGAWVKPGAVVIDVGMNRKPDGKLVGDVEFAAAAERASWITPVPGGVGPMTVAMLMHNTLKAAGG